MNENNKEIIIKIEEGIQTKAFKPENIIHKDAYERIKNLITQNLKEAKEYKKKLEEKDIKEVFKRVHNTITINGERGAGKTSFMLSIKKEYEKDKEIEVLDILDPTLISTRQHVFVLLLAMIEKRVNEKFNGKCREKKFDDSYKNWKESLEDLAKGLNQLDGIGNNPYDNDLWDDSALIMARGLDLAKAGIDLEKRFHIFVNKSLKLLGKKAFLLFIDDIDTDFSKGWEVLEILRKYITTHQIIPIMAGNFELYENLVRKEKSKLFKELIEFDEKMNIHNRNKMQMYSNQVNELTQQYLMKVMQPINLITLYKLYYYLVYKNEPMYIEIPNELEKDELNKIKIQIYKRNEKDVIFLKDFIIKYIFENKFYKIYYPEYLDVITNLPLRTIFQWLYFAKICKDKGCFLEANKNIFIDNFFNLGLNNEFFEIIKTQYGFNKFTLTFITIFSFDDLKEYRPVYDNLDLNIALMIIPQFLNLNRKLSDKLRYGIEVSLQFFIYEILNKNENSYNELQINKILPISLRIKNVLKVLIIKKGINIKIFNQIYKNIDRININVLKSYINSKEEQFKEINDYIEKYKQYRRELKTDERKKYALIIKDFKKFLDNKIKEKEIINKLENLLKENKNLIKNKDLFLSIAFFIIKKGQRELHYYISPLKILGLFFEILEIFENNKSNDLETKENIKRKILYYANEMNWYIIDNDENEEHLDEYEYNENNEYNKLDETLIQELIDWYKKYNDIMVNLNKQLHIIKWSEFYYNFYKKIESLGNSCCITAQDYIKVFLHIFINEIIKILLKNENITLQEISSIRSIKNYSSNLEKLTKNNKEYTNFIEMFENCPIIKYYLNNSLLDKILLVQG
jgi:hypothetical protein